MTEDQFNDIIEDIMTSTWDSGRTKIINLCKSMCDKQREICAENAKIRTRTFSEDEGHDVSFWWNQAEHYNYRGDSIDVYDIKDQSILNAPYPEELI